MNRNNLIIDLVKFGLVIIRMLITPKLFQANENSVIYLENLNELKEKKTRVNALQ